MAHGLSIPQVEQPAQSAFSKKRQLFVNDGFSSCSTSPTHTTSSPERKKCSGLAQALSQSPRGAEARDSNKSELAGDFEVNVPNSSLSRPPSPVLNRVLFDDDHEEFDQVKFRKCGHCQSLFIGSEAMSDSSHRHLFCSGECYITRYAMLRAKVQRRSTSDRSLRRASPHY